MYQHTDCAIVTTVKRWYSPAGGGGNVLKGLQDVESTERGTKNKAREKSIFDAQKKISLVLLQVYTVVHKKSIILGDLSSTLRWP